MDSKIRKQIVEVLEDGKKIPASFKDILFPEDKKKKEYELVYDGKQRKEDILAETMRVPLQPIKTFADENENGWTNKLIFGDNLQVLKELMYDPKVKGKVQLIYIDPPFATQQDFKGSQDQKAYQDKIVGAKFLEFLRKRLIFLHEILANDGSIYVHLDWKKAHYIKALMDEIFEENNFQNEIIWCYREAINSKNRWNRKHDVIYFYSKTEKFTFNYKDILSPYSPGTKMKYKYQDKKGPYRLMGRGIVKSPISSARDVNPRWEKEHPELVYRHYMGEGTFPVDYWNIDIINQAAVERVDFPTQKPEALLERIIKASSNENDIILDVFAGAGTTGAIAEKLNRRWIMVDSSKLAIYTIQKRMLNLRKEIGNKGEKLIPKPFTLYNAGLYDYPKLKDLPFEKYRKFVLNLFQCRDEKHTTSGIELDGFLEKYDVLVFDFQKFKNAVVDYGFIDDLHKSLGDKISDQFFIIAPAASVQFLEDYIEKNGVRYLILRVPYSIIDELHKKPFEFPKQATSEQNINDIFEGYGFDFIQTPEVKCKYFVSKPKGELFKQAIIKIEKLKSEVISRKPQDFGNLETLSMVMIDYDYDGNVFDLDEVFYADNLTKTDYEVRFDPAKIKGEMMIIYCDIFGNEKREIKTAKDFK